MIVLAALALIGLAAAVLLPRSPAPSDTPVEVLPSVQPGYAALRGE